MKNIEITRGILTNLFIGIEAIPPVKYKTIDDMRLIGDDVLPMMKEHLKPIIDKRTEIAEIHKSFNSKKIGEKERNTLLAKVNTELNEIADAGADDEVTVSLENAAFNKVFDLFIELGKDWFLKVEHYLECHDALNDTNKQSGK